MSSIVSMAPRPAKRRRLDGAGDDEENLRHGVAPAPRDTLLVVVINSHHNVDPGRIDVALVDASSGAVVKRLDWLAMPAGGYVCAAGDLLCVVSARHGVLRLIDAATGDVADLSAGGTTAAGDVFSGYTLAQVPSTGEYKVLHVYASTWDEEEQSSEVLTVGGNGGWRPTQSPPMLVEYMHSLSSATVGGVAYFLPNMEEMEIGSRSRGAVVHHDSIAAFDLAAEKWRPELLQGPLTQQGRRTCRNNISLTALDGHLVAVHHDYRSNTMELWSLTTTTTTTATWTRAHCIPLHAILRGQERFAHPWMVLVDGRMAVTTVWTDGRRVRLYDPRTGSCEEVVNLGPLGSIVGFYSPSLLGF